MKISAVLFDIGGVLIELNGLPSIAKLLNSNQSYDDIYKKWMASPSVIAHETGKMQADAFAVGAVHDLELTISPQAFIENFATWIVGVFPDTFSLLEDIPENITIAALSNTSPTHWQRVEETGLAKTFDHLFLSHEIGQLKPAKASFQVVVDTLQLPANEIIFFDDNIDNVNAAINMGFLGQQVLNPVEAKRVLEEYKIFS